MHDAPVVKVSARFPRGNLLTLALPRRLVACFVASPHFRRANFTLSPSPPSPLGEISRTSDANNDREKLSARVNASPIRKQKLANEMKRKQFESWRSFSIFIFFSPLFLSAHNARLFRPIFGVEDTIRPKYPRSRCFRKRKRKSKLHPVATFNAYVNAALSFLRIG